MHQLGSQEAFAPLNVLNPAQDRQLFTDRRDRLEVGLQVRRTARRQARLEHQPAQEVIEKYGDRSPMGSHVFAHVEATEQGLASEGVVLIDRVIDLRHQGLTMAAAVKDVPPGSLEFVGNYTAQSRSPISKQPGQLVGVLNTDVRTGQGVEEITQVVDHRAVGLVVLRRAL